MSDQRPTAAGPADNGGPSIIYRMKTVIRLTGLGRSTIYRLMARHEFPSPVRLASRAVGWRSSDLDRWAAERPDTRH